MRVERERAEERMAQDYAEFLWANDSTGWCDLNEEIAKRWSMTALRRIKRRAWDLVERGRYPRNEGHRRWEDGEQL